MGQVIVRKCTVSEIEAFPNFPILQHEYAEECALEDLPYPQPKMEDYKDIEALGIFSLFGAFLVDALIGYATVMSYKSRHYGIYLTLTESIFVTKSERHTGAGNELIQLTEQQSCIWKSPVHMITAPIGGSLAGILPHKGYKPTNMIFMKRMNA